MLARSCVAEDARNLPAKMDRQKTKVPFDPQDAQHF